MPTLIRLIAALLLAGWACAAQAYVVNITPQNGRAAYLRVGDGAITGGNYNNGGTPADFGTVNVVSVAVPANVLGNGTSQQMSGNASQMNSHYDGYLFCNAGQIYVGGFYRRNSSTGAASLTVAITTPLRTPSGETIPFTQISWTTSSNGPDGDITGEPITDSAFTGAASQVVASFPANTWRETCMSFRFANAAIYAAGTYTGRVTYTLTTP
ncbi:hypothetical protein MNR01_11420 [Lysobacter sp. S4-A87]|uniref:hypothetical protein n=1 Tax=Lysobacter sp. S4-A87 TaxID=2925843 RepID=UPI001F532370|nr:hypothetical protein [Lysobacter sp. S4-A87]UNK48377.1 hypothetical protein MNR01_11420 [Lysobacter sp. S4-A87]